ncbi:unnamed protein product [Rotaria sordida]|uniref:Ig-like domain-containing protein n=1 Tax=Rotaria sordida TaxID=392033 RepID=A0A815G8L2_9BILA|nr:unnamed protein product [Rotaria sordida]CAF1335177.1 unnamed protein product [Rotaria sordida]
MDKKSNEQWACRFTKVKAVVVELDELISQIKADHKIQTMMEEPLSMKTITRSTDTERKSNQLAEISDLSSIDSSSLGKKLDNPIDSGDLLKIITNELIKILALDDDDENKDKIINDLLENGRQSLKNYQEDIISEIYNKQINGNDSELIQLLNKHFQLKWETEYGLSNEWFVSFLKKYQNGEKRHWYEHVLIRTAEHGNRYMKDCPILSIVLQLLFEDIDDKCLKETCVFDDLWFAIKNDGLKSITRFSNYIIPEIMNEQINKKQSGLFQALREFYRQNLSQLFQQSGIRDTQNLCDLALDNIAEDGWIIGAKAIQGKIAPNKFKKLLENIDLFLKQGQVQPKVEAPQSVNDQSCAIGQDTQISWEFSGIEKPQVTWFFNDQLLPTNDRFQVTETDDRISTLSIRQAKLADQGVYTARATNAVGEAEAKTTLNIVGFKTNLDAALQVTKGEIMTLKIVVKGTPKPNAVWMKGNDELTANDRIQVTIPTGDDDTYILTISNVQPKDQGEYSFKITHVSGSLKSNTCKVTVSSMS